MQNTVETKLNGFDPLALCEFALDPGPNFGFIYPTTILQLLYLVVYGTNDLLYSELARTFSWGQSVRTIWSGIR